MSESSSKPSQFWTSDSLCKPILNGSVFLKANTDGKADCWKNFGFVETANSEEIFGWAACISWRGIKISQLSDTYFNVLVVFVVSP